jgi:[ribosomal protein S18]-alanine N-acetyltransferase
MNGEKQRVQTGQIEVRPAHAEDLAEITRIEAVSPEAACWVQGSYLDYDCLVALVNARVAGFLVSRPTAVRETEILNLAVAPEFRRRGLATALLRQVCARHPGDVFLEVRVSNTTARKLYQKLGFQEVGIRPNYYTSPWEDGIVMRFQSC